MSLFEVVVHEGITDVRKFIHRFIEVEAQFQATVHQSLVADAMQRQAMILLPLPPYVVDLIRPYLYAGLAFNTEARFQIHTQRDGISVLDFAAMRQLYGSKLKGISSIVCDGQRFGKSFHLRTGAASILELLLAKGLTKVYIHRIPHLPSLETFETLEIPDNVAFYDI